MKLFKMSEAALIIKTEITLESIEPDLRMSWWTGTIKVSKASNWNLSYRHLWWQGHNIWKASLIKLSASLRAL